MITWQRHPGRAEEIAAALGGRTCHVHPRQLSGGPLRTLVRYAVSVVLTTGHLVLRRPPAVIVTNPPVWPGLLVAAYGRITGRPFVLDSHPASFGAKDNAVARHLLPLHRLMARRAAAVMVTTAHWVAEVQRWGGQGLVVHEAPPQWQVGPRASCPARPRVLFVGVFGSDEPVDVVFEAARQMPDVDFDVTGDVRRCPPHLLDSRPENLRLTGFLGPEEYRRAVEQADVLLVLTTEPTSVVRAGYEAVYVRRVLVVTDTPVLREVFPLAFHAHNNADAIRTALRSALTSATDAHRLDEALRLQTARWAGQFEALQRTLSTDGERPLPPAR